jgi:hypothetical protein
MSDHFVPGEEGDETVSKYVVDIETSLASGVAGNGGETSTALSILKPFDRQKEPSKWDLRFADEDKCVHWCKDTFFEESIVQISFSLLGPLCYPWAIKLCGVEGLKITMFWPAKHKDGSSGVFFFWMQCVFGFGMQTPTLIGTILALTGNLPLYPDSSILPFSHLYIPLMVLIVRQIVIAVKYAFVPRRRMRFDRAKGRSFTHIGDDMLGAWCDKPSNESMARQLDQAMWRVGLTGNEILRFADSVPEEVLKLVDLPETTPKKGKVHDGDASDAAAVPVTGSEGTKDSTTTGNPRPRDELPLRTVIKYAAFTATQEVQNDKNPMLLCLLGCIILPLTFLGMNGKPLFGSSHVEKYFCSVGFMMLMMSIAPNLVGFCMAPSTIFARYRLRQHLFFELLIPSRIVDARKYEPIYTKNDLGKLPPLVPSNQNILLWNKGRQALQKYGVYYRRRVEIFTGMYVFVLAVLAAYQVISIFVKRSAEVSESMIIIAWMIIMVTIPLLKMIFAGIKMNRQRKLLISSMKSLLIRARKDSLEQANQALLGHALKETKSTRRFSILVQNRSPRKAKDSKVPAENTKAAKAILTAASEFHKSIKLIDGEMEAEEVVEKARIMGFTVDFIMLEAIFALFSTTAYTMYDVLYSSNGNTDAQVSS